MKSRNLRILGILVGVFALTTVVACDLEDDEATSCTEDTECAEGEFCDLSGGEGTGVCTEIGGGGGTACDADNPCEGGFACMMAEGETAGTCATSCDADTGCAEGFVCADTGDACEEAADPYVYVGIRSTTGTEGDLSNNTPGPDIDAIQLTSAGATFWAETVENFAVGEGGDDTDGNVNNNPERVTGENDAVLSEDGSVDCDLSEEPDGKFFSMGDTLGYVVVSFGDQTSCTSNADCTEGSSCIDPGTGNQTCLLEIQDGDTIEVYELAASTCGQVSRERDDGFETFVGMMATEPGPGEAGWISLGSSDPTGGMFSAVFNAPTE